MHLLDVDVVLAAHRADHPHHGDLPPWFVELLTGDEPPFPVPVPVWASFLRLATHRRIFRVPTPLPEAFAFVDSTCAQPHHLLTGPGPRHLALLRVRCEEADARGCLVPDAVLAALAAEHSCTVATMDREHASRPSDTTCCSGDARQAPPARRRSPTLSRMLTRRHLLALAGALPVVAAVGCAAPEGSTLEQARRNGAIRIGLAGERPYGYTDLGGRVTGTQPEVARAVFARLGVPGLAAVQVQFDQLIPGLLAGQFDMITAGMTVTPARCDDVAFTRPDFVAPPAFLVRDGNPREIETFRDVERSGVRLAVLTGSAELDYARAVGMPDDRLELVSGQRELFRAVADGEVPVGALTAVSLTDELRRNPGSGLEVTDPTVPQVDGRRVVPAGAFAVRPEDVDLRTEFDGELTALQESGEWLRITEPFGFTSANLPPDGLRTELLCRPD